MVNEVNFTRLKDSTFDEIINKYNISDIKLQDISIKELIDIDGNFRLRNIPCIVIGEVAYAYKVEDDKK